MKYYLIIAFAALLSACGQNNNNRASTTTSPQDSLMSVINERDSSINDFLATNNEIEHNLDAILMKEHAIAMGMKNKSELPASAKDRINADIASINNLMKENRRKINELDRRLKKSNAKTAEYDKMIAELNARIADRDAEIVALNNQLAQAQVQVAALETSMAVLAAENADQSQTIDQQTAQLHTAYYIVGTSKDLKDKKIIDKKGGLLGVGRTAEIDPNIDNSNFTKIDYTQTNNIDINGKSAKLITAQPADSYSITKNQDKTISLKIINPDKFWSASKYLVVESK